MMRTPITCHQKSCQNWLAVVVGTGGQVQVCLIVCTLVYRGSRTPKLVHGLVLVQESFAAQQNGLCSNIEESAPFFLAQNVLQCV